MFRNVFCYAGVNILTIHTLTKGSETLINEHPTVQQLLINTTSGSLLKLLGHNCDTSREVLLLTTKGNEDGCCSLWAALVDFSGHIFFGVSLRVGEADQGLDWASYLQRGALLWDRRWLFLQVHFPLILCRWITEWNVQLLWTSGHWCMLRCILTFPVDVLHSGLLIVICIIWW